MEACFGELLKSYRRQRGIRQQGLAQRLGVHRNTIGKWERGDCLPNTRGAILEIGKQLGLNEYQTYQLLLAGLVEVPFNHK